MFSGNALFEIGLFNEVFKMYDCALQIHPNYAAYCNGGSKYQFIFRTFTLTLRKI